MRVRFMANARSFRQLAFGVSVLIAGFPIGEAVGAGTQGSPGWHAALGLSTVTRVTHDDDADGVPDGLTYESESEYDNEGNLVLLVERRMQGGNWRRVVTSSTYDRAARLTYEVTETDLGDDGTVDSLNERWLDYDERGDVVEERTRVHAGGRFSADRTVREYDAAGRLVDEFRERDDGADGTVDYVGSTSMSYDMRGDLVERSSWSDYQNDGMPDSRSTATWSYNEHGDVLESVVSNDNDNDGVADTLDLTTRTYDTRGLVEEEVVRDYAPEGVLTAEGVTDFTHNDAGQLVETFTSSSSAGYSLRQTYLYDPGGNLIDRESHEDHADGSSYDGSSFWRFDREGHLIQTELVLTKDDVRILGSIQTYVYDRWANVLSVTSTQDQDGDGSADFISTTIHEYGPE